MKNRLTFSNIINVLLDNKKKTYTQYQMISDMFSLCMNTDHNSMDADEINTEAITYSRWVSGARPIPVEIVKTYDEDDEWDVMQNDFNDYIIPNLINVSNAREQIEELINDSIETIGETTARELLNEQDNSVFFANVMRYAIISNHGTGKLYSPDLSDIILGNRLPSVTREFTGRKNELKEIDTILKQDSHVFITGIAGIGKSELAKAFAHKSKKKYTNIIYIYYSGNLKNDISNLIFSGDSADATTEELFTSHYSVLQKLKDDSLLILDNFNKLPKEEPFLRDLLKYNFQVIITSRCKIAGYSSVEIGTLDEEKELKSLFHAHCPSSNQDDENIVKIIEILNFHTLTVCLASKTMQASGISSKELLDELVQSGIRKNTNEIELYKDDDFEYASMIGHLQKLMSLSKLADKQLDILKNLCLMPLSGIPKDAFRKWLELDNLNTVNELIRYGIITEDTTNNLISLHQMIMEVSLVDTMPTVLSCEKLLNHLHFICLARGLDVTKPVMITKALTSINNRIIIDDNDYYLSFLQDMFPYFEKYGLTDALPDIISRIELLMNEKESNITELDKALLLDYKAWLLITKKEYVNAIKKYNKAIRLVENYHNSNEASVRSANLLSNIHNNLSTALMLKGKKEDAANALKKAFSIRKDFSYLGIMENNDTIQQTFHMVRQSLILKDYSSAENILQFTLDIITNYLGINNLDYATGMFYQGIISLNKKDHEGAKSAFDISHSLFRKYLGEDYEYSILTKKYLDLPFL
jgi:tetratricopeptide (TPR) repeat protein